MNPTKEQVSRGVFSVINGVQTVEPAEHRLLSVAATLVMARHIKNIDIGQLMNQAERAILDGEGYSHVNLRAAQDYVRNKL